MHVLGHYGKENAAAIFELFLECMPEYPLDKPDTEGNTGQCLRFCLSSAVYSRFNRCDMYTHFGVLFISAYKSDKNVAAFISCPILSRCYLCK